MCVCVVGGLESCSFGLWVEGSILVDACRLGPKAQSLRPAAEFLGFGI